jgi:hypothetical protein
MQPGLSNVQLAKRSKLDPTSSNSELMMATSELRGSAPRPVAEGGNVKSTARKCLDAVRDALIPITTDRHVASTGHWSVALVDTGVEALGVWQTSAR